MGCVVLRRLKDAEAKGNRVLAKVARAIAASAGAADTSLEGAGRVYEQPCPQGMRQMFIRAYSSAGIPFRRLNYMECHGAFIALVCVCVWFVFPCLPASRPPAPSPSA